MDHYSFITKILVAPNGVDLAFFDIVDTKQQARDQLGLPQDKIIIGYVGRTEVAGKDKGVGILKEAFERMRERAKAELLLVVSVSYTQIPMYLRAIDIAVIPYPGVQHAKTTSPMKLHEYQASGKAIIVADSYDAGRLADMLDSLVANPDRITMLGARARAEAVHHTWDQRAKKILESIECQE